jgi:hypothetical protein
MLGPVSGARGGGSGWPLILFGSAFLIYSWVRYLRGDIPRKVTRADIIHLTIIILLMIGAGIWIQCSSKG